MKRCFSFIFLSIIALSALTGCLSNSGESSISASVACTITGQYPNYKFYMDGGGVMTATSTSITEITQGKGFTEKRAIIYFNYYKSNVTTTSDGEMNISDAEISNGYYIRISDPMVKAVADENLITSADSTFNVVSVNSMWVYDGYLTVSNNLPYYFDGSTYKTPTCTLVYDQSDFSENSISLHVYVNCHVPKTTINYRDYVAFNSFDVAPFSVLVPGSGDIKAEVYFDGMSQPVSFEIERSELVHRSY